MFSLIAATLVFSSDSSPRTPAVRISAVRASAVRVPALADQIWGVTIDNVSQPESIVETLRSLQARPTARIVFDPGASPAYSAGPLKSIHDVANVMGSPIDSAPPSGKMTVGQYRDRVAGFMDALGSNVDLWEIGNEVNGDWTCDSAEMGAKIQAALHETQARHRPAALTLFYSDFYKGKDREMVAWSRKYLSERVRKGLDYVLVSFYPDSATGPHPDWKTIFKDLADTFPNAKVGFGELGLRKADFSLSDDNAEKQKLIERYYRMASPLPGRYIGGYFWWTYRQDANTKSSPLWATFADVIR